MPQSPATTESVKSAADLFGAPTNVQAEVVAVAVSDEPVKEEAVDDVLPVPAVQEEVGTPQGESVEPEAVELTEPKTTSDEPPSTEEAIDAVPSAESPSKLLDDESEMLQEVPLSPTKDQE